MPRFTTDLSGFSDARLSQLHEYWLNAHQEDLLPARSHIDPLDIPSLLPNIALVEVDPESDRLKVRLAGTAVSELFPRSITGAYVDSVFKGESGRQVIAQYDYSRRHGVPTYMNSSLLDKMNNEVRYERLVLPMALDGRKVDMFLVMLAFPNRKHPKVA